MHYLICDVNIKRQGHYIGYNQYIIDNVHKFENKASGISYSFLYNREAEVLLKFPEALKDKVKFLDSNGWDTPGVQSKIKLFKKISSFAESHRIDHLIFIDLDQYQLPIFLAEVNFEISGILFRPHHRITAASNGFFPKLSSWLQRAKKNLAEKLLLISKGVKNIYILNDEEGVEQLNKIHRSNKFKYLPDPIFTYSSSVPERKINTPFTFLIFGAINERKNISTIIKAYEGTEFDRETELLIVGSAKDDYLEYLYEFIEKLQGIRKEKKITVKPGFVSNEEMDQYFSKADACLLIYKDFYGSSGLLGRASLHRKKVISTNVGLLKELVEKNHLGITCSPDNIEEISVALRKIINTEVDSSYFDKFYNKYSPESFISTLLTKNL